MRECIYCRQLKAPTAFNREHVLHRSMGSFRNPLLLECVCRQCNQRFGDTIDLTLGRDSPEGFGRVWDGVKAPEEFRRGKGKYTRIETDDLAVRHLYMHALPAVGTNRFAGLPAEQVVFMDGDRKLSRLVDDLPTPTELAALGFPTAELQIGIMSHTPQAVIDALLAKGFPRVELGERLPSPAATFKGELVFTITHPQLRAIAKIALNYLASELGAGTAMLGQFDRIRHYIREDNVTDSGLVKSAPPLVPTSRSTQATLAAHWISLERIGNTVLSHVCFFSRTCYEVLLSELPFQVQFAVGSCHVFDIAAREVRACAPCQSGYRKLRSGSVTNGTALTPRRL